MNVMLTAVKAARTQRRLAVPAWVYVLQAVFFPALTAAMHYRYSVPLTGTALCCIAGCAGFNVAMALMTWFCNRILREG